MMSELDASDGGFQLNNADIYKHNSVTGASENRGEMTKRLKRGLC